jgi:predicted MFS family arabinose efflux permease
VALSLGSLVFASTVRGRRAERPRRASSVSASSFLDLNIVVPSLMTFFTYFAGGAVFAFVPLYGLTRGVTNPGYFFFAISIMLFLGRILGARILVAHDKENIIRTFLFAFVAGLAILPFGRSLPLFILSGLLWGTGFAFVVPTTMAYALEYGGASGGTSVGTYQMFMDLGLALGPAIMGMVLPLIGYPLMFFSLALLCLSNIAYFQFYVRARKTRRAGMAESRGQ